MIRSFTNSLPCLHTSLAKFQASQISLGAGLVTNPTQENRQAEKGAYYLSVLSWG